MFGTKHEYSGPALTLALALDSGFYHAYYSLSSGLGP